MAQISWHVLRLREKLEKKTSTRDRTRARYVKFNDVTPGPQRWSLVMCATTTDWRHDCEFPFIRTWTQCPLLTLWLYTCPLSISGTTLDTDVLRLHLDWPQFKIWNSFYVCVWDLYYCTSRNICIFEATSQYWRLHSSLTTDQTQRSQYGWRIRGKCERDDFKERLHLIYTIVFSQSPEISRSSHYHPLHK